MLGDGNLGLRKPGVAVCTVFLICCECQTIRPLNLPERPRLAPGVRLHFDRTRDAWVLLGPNGWSKPKGPPAKSFVAAMGSRTIAQIVDELGSSLQRRSRADRRRRDGDACRTDGKADADGMTIGVEPAWSSRRRLACLPS